LILLTIYSVLFPLFLQNEPIFCPLTHLIALAVDDNAFENPKIQSVEQVFDLKVEGPVQSTILYWKPGIRKAPIFRHPAKFGTERRPLSAALFQFYLGRLGRMAGFKDKLTTYCGRRTTANALIGMSLDPLAALY